jgi:hypothetical protein
MTTSNSCRPWVCPSDCPPDPLTPHEVRWASAAAERGAIPSPGLLARFGADMLPDRAVRAPAGPVVDRAMPHLSTIL